MLGVLEAHDQLVLGDVVVDVEQDLLDQTAGLGGHGGLLGGLHQAVEAVFAGHLPALDRGGLELGAEGRAAEQCRGEGEEGESGQRAVGHRRRLERLYIREC